MTASLPSRKRKKPTPGTNTITDLSTTTIGGHVVRRTILGALVFGFVAASAVKAADAADPKAIIDKAIQATGGEAKLAKNHGMIAKMKGQFHGMGTPIDYTGEMTVADH